MRAEARTALNRNRLCVNRCIAGLLRRFASRWFSAASDTTFYVRETAMVSAKPAQCAK